MPALQRVWSRYYLTLDVQIIFHPAALKGTLMSPQTRCSGENASITARTSLIFWLRLQEHQCSDHHHLQGMLLTFSTRHARFNVCIQEGLHSSIYKHVCVSVLLLGPWTAPSVQILLHVAQSTSNIFHFFLYLHSSQLLLRLWIPCRKSGNNFSKGTGFPPA